MARYIDCDKCYHRYACAGDTDKWNYYGECPHYTNSADVVPRSEYEDLELKLEAERSFKPLAITLAKQEVAREIFEEIEKYLAMFSHIHKYAEEARQSNEEYADGTPCEMTSVWEVLSLHKNGWDDYETMCKLQDNIGNIEKSRLLAEFEKDIAELEKKYIGE